MKRFPDIQYDGNDPVEKAFFELPATAKCPKCKEELPKSDFGMRVMKRDDKGNPVKVRRQSYCRNCR